MRPLLRRLSLDSSVGEGDKLELRISTILVVFRSALMRMVLILNSGGVLLVMCTNC